MLYRLRNEVQHRETKAGFCSIKLTKRMFLQGGRVALHPDRIVVTSSSWALLLDVT